MKAIWLAMSILIFNICMAAVAHSGLFTAAPYYEDTVIEHYQGLENFTNMSKTDLEPQTIDVWSYLLQSVTFEWANQYTAGIGIEDDIRPFILGMDAIAVFLYAVAMIEFLWRQNISG